MILGLSLQLIVQFEINSHMMVTAPLIDISVHRTASE
jgi:hypothetical protein